MIANSETMIPVGYMAKRVVDCPRGWIDNEVVRSVHSVSSCLSKEFTDYVNFWRHNGYWFFDSPEIIVRVAKENDIDMSGTTFFRYEAYEFEYDEDDGEWRRFHPETSFKTSVVPPREFVFEGYDVVTFSVGNTPECSPLSCNKMADSIPVNEFCLMDSFDEAKASLDAGRFNMTEPGPFRIMSVNVVEKPKEL